MNPLLSFASLWRTERVQLFVDWFLFVPGGWGGSLPVSCSHWLCRYRMWSRCSAGWTPGKQPDLMTFHCISTQSLCRPSLTGCHHSLSSSPYPRNQQVSLSDYRPVAFTPVNTKCLEWLVLQHIKACTPPSFDPPQFAYRTNINRGCHSHCPSHCTELPGTLGELWQDALNWLPLSLQLHYPERPDKQTVLPGTVLYLNMDLLLYRGRGWSAAPSSPWRTFTHLAASAELEKKNIDDRTNPTFHLFDLLAFGRRHRSIRTNRLGDSLFPRSQHRASTFTLPTTTHTQTPLPHSPHHILPLTDSSTSPQTHTSTQHNTRAMWNNCTKVYMEYNSPYTITTVTELTVLLSKHAIVVPVLPIDHCLLRPLFCLVLSSVALMFLPSPNKKKTKQIKNTWVNRSVFSVDQYDRSVITGLTLGVLTWCCGVTKPLELK